MIYQHKKTGQKLLLKERGSFVSTYFKLDDSQNKILNFLSKKHKYPMRDIKGNVCFELAVCCNDNVTELKQNHLNPSIERAVNA